MIIQRSKNFIKAFKKSPKKLRLKVLERIELFLEHPDHRQLNVHPLSGELKGVYSLNVTGDYRIWFTKEKIHGNPGEIIITFLMLGNHSNLY